jgi:uncharacterized membrane protein
VRTRLSRLTLLLFCIFCVAYLIAVIGVAFDVHPPFLMAWAGSVLLILEGIMVTVAWMDEYGPPALLAALVIVIFSYGVVALGVNTGFPFGSYRYTDILYPILPGGVPLPVVFAWLMIIVAVRSITVRPPLLVGGRWLVSVLVSACLATLLDLVLEPVAFHLEHFWVWLAPGNINYYGVPLVHFVAWFMVSLLLISLVNLIMVRAISFQNLSSFSSRLPLNLPIWLYFANVFMFGLADLIHGYYLAAGIAALAAILPFVVAPLPTDITLPVMLSYGVEQDQEVQPYRERVKKTKKVKRAKKKRKR